MNEGDLHTNLYFYGKAVFGWVHDNPSIFIPLLALFVSFCSLLFTAVSFRGTKRSGDLTALIKFVETLQVAEKNFFSEEDSAKDDRFVELLNLLEAYCAAYHANLLPRKTRELVRDKLIDALALIRRYDAWAAKFSESTVGEKAFAELERFEKAHHKRIAMVASKLAAPAQ